MKKLLILSLTAVVVLGMMLAGCSGSKGTIVVGSKIDTEGSLLGQMMILMLQDKGYDVVDKTQTGATSIVKAALETGEIDMYPE